MVIFFVLEKDNRGVSLMRELFLLADGGVNPQAMSQIQLMLMLMMGLVAYWLLFLRPHNKKKKEMKNKIDSLSKGSEIISIGGVHGKVVQVKDNVVVVRIDDKATITFDKSAIATVVDDKNNKKELASETEVNKKQKTENEDEEK